MSQPDPVRDLLDVVHRQGFAAGVRARRWSWWSFRVGVVAGLALAAALLLV